MTEAVVGQLQL